jgi:hypothetical protein
MSVAQRSLGNYYMFTGWLDNSCPLFPSTFEAHRSEATCPRPLGYLEAMLALEPGLLTASLCPKQMWSLHSLPWQLPLNNSVRFYLMLFRLLHQKSIDYVAYKQQKLVSHSSAGWEVQDQCAGRCGTGKGKIPDFLDLLMVFSLCPTW